MTYYVVALYVVPVLVAVAALIVGAIGMKFYWDTVIRKR
ncbi:hypothetical protein EV191_12814 [Tamaricihabitans halophyticus]|uniref:Uncharacterized protein n=1 Tax=Tamaricihabitans halophyticus TaxID=1262583 RepID=A0A4R2PZF9_9PSEU|nr:hypothetical protein EV191_12814 [Tamaricihabitans halophyticus]